jgi:hypothetical protein
MHTSPHSRRCKAARDHSPTYEIGMIVIIRNRGRTFLLARNETGHLPIPRLRLTRLKSRPMIRRCAGGHKKSRWTAVAIHKRDICGRLQVSPDVGDHLTSRPGQPACSPLRQLTRFALRNTLLTPRGTVAEHSPCALDQDSRSSSAPPPLHEGASETPFESADLISRGAETASASRPMSSSQTFMLLLKSCRAFSGPIRNEKASNALLHFIRLVLDLSNWPSSDAVCALRNRRSRNSKRKPNRWILDRHP